MPDADGNPLDEAEARAILRGGAGNALMQAAASYIAPLFWGPVEANKAGQTLRNGSAFFMQVDGLTFLATAAHVIRKLEAHRLAFGAALRCYLMKESFDPLVSLIDIDDDIDIATVRVPEALPKRVGCWTYRRLVSEWPPAPPTEGRGLFFAGYPGIYRTEGPDSSVQFGLYGGLLTATSVSQTDIIAQLDHEHIEALPGMLAPPHNAWLGGMSGAPGWTMTQVGWRLAGVLRQASTDYELFYFRTADHIRSDGTINRRPQLTGK